MGISFDFILTQSTGVLDPAAIEHFNEPNTATIKLKINFIAQFLIHHMRHQYLFLLETANRNQFPPVLPEWSVGTGGESGTALVAD